MNRISVGLQRFKKVKTNVWACRCPICGDSKKSTKLTRFFFYVKKQNMLVWCHNCGYSKSFYNFMRDQYSSQFEEYKRETLFDTFNQRASSTAQTNTVETLTTTPDELLDVVEGPTGIDLDEFKRVSINVMSLPETHPAVVFLKGRAFTEHEMRRLYYTDDFKSVALMMNEEAGLNLLAKESRILIPFVNTDGVVEMLQGRALKDSKMKYITIKAHDDVEKLYGLYEMDPKKTTYCVEGPFDSLFVDNCIATCDANLVRSKADVLIWDNEPMNPNTCKYISNAIEEGKKVVIWPSKPFKKVDINDMVKSGMSHSALMNTIKAHTYSGMMAKAKFIQWKRV
jgi:transcription elongation factor Elf1